MAEDGRFDVFLSYAFGDGRWPVALAENLERLGLDVWLAGWEMVPGQRIATRLQDGLARADVLVAVVSPKWVESEWCDEEFAAAIGASADGRQRVIPVLWGEAELPPFVVSRLYVDFRTVATPAQYEERVRELAEGVRGRPSMTRPARTGEVVAPDGLAYRPDGPIQAELRIGADSVVFSAGGTEVAAASLDGAEPDQQLEELLWGLGRARERVRGGHITREAPAVQETRVSGGVDGALGAVGRALGERFAGGEVGGALKRVAALARDCHAPLRIGLQVDEPRWRDLPWETLVVPGDGRPLVLSEQVELYRKVERETAPVVAVRVAGPLRILAVVASPEHGRGELLDYERELARILNAVDPARARQGAYVRVLNWGSVHEIRAALLEERFHVLHLSCHAGPGVLYLESDDGGVDTVDAGRFMDEVLPTGHGVPLVVLAGCSTALAPEAGEADGGSSDGTSGDEAAAEARAGLARELLARGVPSVLAMTEAVTDTYATDLATRVYEELARVEHPLPLAAISRARRDLEAARRRLPAENPFAGWPEWSTPSLFLAGAPLPLFDAGQVAERVAPMAEPVLQEGMAVRKVGEFVGRRAELRRLLGALRDPRRAGVLVHGIGGVGKSTLAAELLHHLGTEAGLVVPVSAATAPTVDAVLETVRQRLLAHCLSAGLPDDDVVRQVATALTDAKPAWRERWELIRQLVLPRVRLLLVLDNAEDLLARVEGSWELSDSELADFLSAWAGAAPEARLVVTSRYPFVLPQRRHRRLLQHHLGPLSFAETRKLMWRLPGLDALDPAEQQRAYADVGGHPRALEYLDALLRGGEARFPDIAERLEDALDRRGIRNPGGWLAGVAGDLDRALAETVTLAVDDVLLDTLLAQLEGVPEARRLLEGLAVYRTAVDWVGAAWQLSGPTAVRALDRALLERIKAVGVQIEKARAAGATAQDNWGLPRATVDQYARDKQEASRPPVEPNTAFKEALRLLSELGLVSPAFAPHDKPEDPPTGLVVHRWTADALQQRAGTDDLTTAHRRAAAYWRWRVTVWPQEISADIVQAVEARHHHHQAGELDEALAATWFVCEHLHTRGAWAWEKRLVEESLTWFPPRSREAAAHIQRLGTIAEQRGDYDEAERHYLDSLPIREEIDDRVGIASTYHYLGIVAQERGHYAEAERHHRKSLAIEEELDNQAGIAVSYHQLGRIAEDRGSFDEAERHYRNSLAIKEEIDDRAEIAVSYHHLGIVAQARGNSDEAERHYRNSLAIEKELGNQTGISGSYHQLGTIAQQRGDLEEAELHYRKSLAIAEELGNRAGIASTIGQLGVLRTQQQQPEQGLRYNVQALLMHISMRIPLSKDLYWLNIQRTALGDDAFRAVLHDYMSLEDTEAVIQILQAQASPAEDDQPPAAETASEPQPT
ncbi:hypothetical protein ADK57_36495 [Streptomyces sp. MMG1533]|uniref:tetratricopeptide repeat protein n=1 Tax=Streptomyces sp. MMG1533 TaxID=1415546 RepID=UPI0006AE75A8|nr:tetratricopeptide repeat protein [Streptomyces sp. MMG1533]KOU58526.1 hypothetical protein ADK57_36495 [Streptomyces sp. MMG1533]